VAQGDKLEMGRTGKKGDTMKRRITLVVICITEETMKACEKNWGQYMYITKKEYESLHGQIDLCYGKICEGRSVVHLKHNGILLPARDVKKIDSWTEECRD
jgi:hypothetical protein